MKTPTITKKLKMPVWRTKLVRDGNESYSIIKSEHDLFELFSAVFAFLRDEPQEHFYVLMLDNQNKPIGLHLVSKGTVSASLVGIADVFRPAILAGARSIAVCHNHPSGSTTASKEDLEVTKQLVDAGKLLGIDVLDHIIIASRPVSIRANDYRGIWS